MKKLKRNKKKETPAPMMSGPKPVSIHLHAEGAHLKEAQMELAKQLKPLGFTQKKKGRAKRSGKSISEALSS